MTLKRYEAFWRHEPTDCALLNLCTRNVESVKPTSIEEKWSGIPYRLAALERNLAGTKYYADGFAHHWVNLGPGALAAMVGGDYTFAENTVWFDQNPTLHDLDDVKSLSLRADAPMNRLVLDLTRAYQENNRGRYITGITDIGGTLDVLASLHGTEQLLMDLIDAPEQVERAARHIDDLFLLAFEQSYDLLRRYNPGGWMTAWIPIACPERWYPLQCDLSAMISPDDFARFVTPSLTRACEALGHGIYHLDGPGELAHVDHLLAIEKLDGIQWVPGSGSDNLASDKWFPLYERIQRAGKCVVLTLGGETTQEVLHLLKNLSPTGLFMSYTAGSDEEAEEIARKAKEYGRRAR